MRLFLGIDGGQSTTTAVIGDDSGRILGSGRGGPCNHVGSAEGRKSSPQLSVGVCNVALRAGEHSTRHASPSKGYAQASAEAPGTRPSISNS